MTSQKEKNTTRTIIWIVISAIIIFFTAPWIEVFFFPQKANIIYSVCKSDHYVTGNHERSQKKHKTINIKYTFIIGNKLVKGETTRPPGSKVFDKSNPNKWISIEHLFKLKPCEVHYCSWWPACHILKVKE